MHGNMNVKCRNFLSLLWVLTANGTRRVVVCFDSHCLRGQNMNRYLYADVVRCMQEDMGEQEVTGRNRTLEIGLGTITTSRLSSPLSMYSLPHHEFYDFSETDVCTDGKAIVASAGSTIRGHMCGVTNIF